MESDSDFCRRIAKLLKGRDKERMLEFAELFNNEQEQIIEPEY